MPRENAGGPLRWRRTRISKTRCWWNSYAHAGIDIGNTLIGMHLRHVAIPVRVSVRTIGKAQVVCARTRPKYIGGSRAVYDERLL